MWTCDILAGLKFLEEITGSSFCLSSIRPVEGTPIILFEDTSGNIFAYNYNTGLLDNERTEV